MSFLWNLVASDEKWIYYENPKRRKQDDQHQHQNAMFLGKKKLLCIWWDEWYYELLKPGETVTGESYSLQLNHLAEKIQEKRPYTGHGRQPNYAVGSIPRPRLREIVSLVAFKTKNELFVETRNK